MASPLRKIPVMHVHIVSARNVPTKSGDVSFITVLYNGVKVGTTLNSDQQPGTKRPVFDERFVIEEPLTPDPAPPGAKAGITFELWAGPPAPPPTTHSWHQKGDAQESPRNDEQPAAAAALGDSVVVHAAQAAAAAATQQLLFASRHISERLSAPAAPPPLELLGSCTVGPRLLLDLAARAHPVELPLRAAGGGWRSARGALRVRLTAVRLQLWLLGATGFDARAAAAAGDTQLSLRATWRGRDLPVPRHASWTHGFCLNPAINGVLEATVWFRHARRPEDEHDEAARRRNSHVLSAARRRASQARSGGGGGGSGGSSANGGGGGSSDSGGGGGSDSGDGSGGGGGGSGGGDGSSTVLQAHGSADASEQLNGTPSVQRSNGAGDLRSDADDVGPSGKEAQQRPERRSAAARQRSAPLDGSLRSPVPLRGGSADGDGDSDSSAQAVAGDDGSGQQLQTQQQRAPSSTLSHKIPAATSPRTAGSGGDTGGGSTGGSGGGGDGSGSGGAGGMHSSGGSANGGNGEGAERWAWPRSEEVRVEVGRQMHLSTYDAQGLADALNGAGASTAAAAAACPLGSGFDGWRAAGLRVHYVAAARRFALYSTARDEVAAFVLRGARSTLATQLLGFSPRDHASALSDAPLPLGGEQGGAARCQCVLSDMPLPPLESPRWFEVVWGPPALELLRSNGQLNVEVWRQRSAAPAAAAAAADVNSAQHAAAAGAPPPPPRRGSVVLAAVARRGSALLAVPPRRALRGRVSLSAEQLRALAATAAPGVTTPLCLERPGGGGGGGGTAALRRWRGARRGAVISAPRTRPAQSSSGQHGGVGNGDADALKASPGLDTVTAAQVAAAAAAAEAAAATARGNAALAAPIGGSGSGDGIAGIVNVSVQLRDESQLLVKVLQRWTLPRDERVAGGRQRAAAQARRRWMLLPGRSAAHAALEILDLLLLVAYAVIMLATAVHRRRCALDWECDAREDASLSTLARRQSALDALLMLSSVLGALLALRTGYVDADGAIVVAPARVAWRYLRTRALLDVLTVLPHNALPKALGDAWFEAEALGAESTLDSKAAVVPETPLALLVFRLGKKLRWNGVNAVRRSRAFRAADLWIENATLTQSAVDRILRSRKHVLEEYLGIPAEPPTMVGRVWNRTRMGTLWVHRVVEYKLVPYIRLALSLTRSIRLLAGAIALLPRTARLLRLGVGAVRSVASSYRAFSEDEAALLVQRRVRQHFARRLAERLRARVRARALGGAGYGSDGEADVRGGGGAAAPRLSRRLARMSVAHRRRSLSTGDVGVVGGGGSTGSGGGGARRANIGRVFGGRRRGGAGRHGFDVSGSSSAGASAGGPVPPQ